jgi:hypothetical protein
MTWRGTYIHNFLTTESGIGLFQSAGSVLKTGSPARPWTEFAITSFLFAKIHGLHLAVT